MVTAVASTATAAIRFPRIRFRPRVSVSGTFSGVVGGLGVVVLLQQFAIAYPTRNVALVGIVGGAVVHLLLVNAGRAANVSRLNARLAAAEARLAAAPAVPGFVAGHVVPSAGLEARAEPDAAQPVSAVLAAGVELQLLQQNGDWAYVMGGNGWTGWVDARLLRSVRR